VHPHLSEVLPLIETSRAAVRAAVDAVHPNQRAVRPGPDRWSVHEVLEHLALVESRFAATIAEPLTRARAGGLGPETGPRVSLSEATRRELVDRGSRRSAPESMLPVGVTDEDAAWAALERSRREFLDVVVSGDGLALSEVFGEHRRWGALNVYQWVEVLAGHEHRHAEQILEIAYAQTR